jgi:MFS family permease
MAERTLLDMNRRQWGVLFAAWLGWGFDVFDALLFNYVATNCIVTLLALTPGTPEAKSAVLFWTGVASSVLLVGAAIGGIAFGRVADRLGRSRTMLITMGLYALATAACALAPNLAALVVLRFVAALGIGGEWAAGAAMVAEVVPEKRRVEAGALLYTAAPIGLFLATGVNWLVAGVLLSGDPSTSCAGSSRAGCSRRSSRWACGCSCGNPSGGRRRGRRPRVSRSCSRRGCGGRPSRASRWRSRGC